MKRDGVNDFSRSDSTGFRYDRGGGPTATAVIATTGSSRSRLIIANTLILTAVAACLGAWLIPAILGGLAAAIVLIARDHRTRENRSAPSIRQ